MRLGSSSLFYRHASGKDGAIVEQGDGELIFPPVLQLTTSVGAPMRNIASIATAQESSFLIDRRVQQSGVQAGGIASFAILSPGLWHISWSAWAAFVGTNDPTKLAAVALRDPNSAQYRLFERPFLTSAVGHSASGQLQIDITDDGWDLAVITSATLITEEMYLFASISANKLA